MDLRQTVETSYLTCGTVELVVHVPWKAACSFEVQQHTVHFAFQCCSGILGHGLIRVLVSQHYLQLGAVVIMDCLIVE